MILLDDDDFDSRWLDLRQELRREQACTVYMCRYHSMDLEVKAESCGEKGDATKATRALLLREIGVLSKLRHPGLAMLCRGRAGSCEAVVMVREHAARGTLRDLLARRRAAASAITHSRSESAAWAQQAFGLIIEMMQALKYLHQVSLPNHPPNLRDLKQTGISRMLSARAWEDE